MIASQIISLDKLFNYIEDMENFLKVHDINYIYNIYVSDLDSFKVEIITYDNR